MKETELRQQISRITRYRELEKVRNEMQAALTAVTQDWKDGPCGKGPFTGNTRESRLVQSMNIKFTATQGSSDPVEMTIPTIHIKAFELGQFLANALRTKIAALNDEMEKV